MSDISGKSALVVEGGAMRGIFAAGVLHAFGKSGFFPFDLYIGVSAGACNLASYLAGQNDRNHAIFTSYSTTSRFISLKRFILGGHLIDLDWLWEITIKEYRLDLQKIFSRNGEFIIVVTDRSTGKPVYLEPDSSTLEHYLKASSSMPLFYRAVLTAGSRQVTDGGIADSIPVQEAYRRGARWIMVIRSRKRGYMKRTGLGTRIFSLAFARKPAFRRAVLDRAANYQESAAYINNHPSDVRILEVAPPDNFRTGRFTQDIEILQNDYDRGIQAGYQAMEEYQRVFCGV